MTDPITARPRYPSNCHKIDLLWDEAMGLGDLRQDIKEWLNERYPHKWTWEKAWLPVNEPNRGGNWFIEFRFWDPSHAMLFKLTWGGASE